MNLKKIVNSVLIVSVIIFAALAFAPQAMAQDTTPPSDVSTVQIVDESPAAPTNPSLPDVAVLIAIVAFIRKRFKLEEEGVIITAISVGAVLWFAPMLSAAFPASAYWIDGTMAFIKWILASMGAVDFTINTGAKIATATKKDIEGEGK